MSEDGTAAATREAKTRTSARTTPAIEHRIVNEGTDVLDAAAVGSVVEVSQQNRIDASDPARWTVLGLPTSLDAPALARLHLTRFRAQLTPAIFGDALILVSELVTNAVLYGEPDISMSVRVETASLVVSVSDASQVLPPRKPGFPVGAARRGRGLAIVESLATEWGINRHESGPGKDVWFRLASPLPRLMRWAPNCVEPSGAGYESDVTTDLTSRAGR